MEVSGQFRAPTAFTLGREPPSTHWIGSRLGPRVSLEAVEKGQYLNCRKSNPVGVAVLVFIKGSA
jgi:hypothetical protein